MAQLVDAYVSEAYLVRVGGSSPLWPTERTWWNGIHASLRSWSREGWRFKSSRPH